MKQTLTVINLDKVTRLEELKDVKLSTIISCLKSRQKMYRDNKVNYQYAKLVKSLTPAQRARLMK